MSYPEYLPVSEAVANIRAVVKIDVEAVGRMLTGGRHIRGMPTFTLAGVKYDYLAPKFEGDPEEVHSWEYGKWPHVEADVPLTGGGTVTVYGQASSWHHDQIIVTWIDDDRHTLWAWIPAATASEWDVIEYHRCPPERRAIRWGNRLPGFLPD